MTDPVPVPQPTPRRPAARLALVSGFTLLFFAGASFTAGAGDRVAAMLEGDEAVALDQVGAVAAALEVEAAPEPAPAAEPEAAPEPAAAPAPADPEPAAADPAPAPEPAAASEPAPATEAATPAAPTETETATAAPTETDQPLAPRQATAPTNAAPAPERAPRTASSAPTRKWVTARAQLTPARPAEIERHGAEAATIWLNRALPDPTPPSARLTRTFARSLASTAKRNGADWATVLGVLRAQGERGSVPATTAELGRLAGSLNGNAWRGALALSGRTSFADRAEALADYYRAVGLESLVTGLEQSKPRLVEQLLADGRVSIYEAGRADLAAGRIDVRIVVLLSYLAERHGSLTVSSLFSGHRKYARPGVVSAHVYGQAVDLAAIEGASIAGNQQPGGPTEAAVRSILLLPAELQPQQVISLLGLGGPSFPLANHGDHIHVGF
ncbi:MAG TPA: hypothetical protein VNI55_13450 [Gaiellaceae bacterium]|nr:hypothetical protein [Gaiellaceae bacterium]